MILLKFNNFIDFRLRLKYSSPIDFRQQNEILLAYIMMRPLSIWPLDLTFLS